MGHRECLGHWVRDFFALEARAGADRQVGDGGRDVAGWAEADGVDRSAAGRMYEHAAWPFARAVGVAPHGQRVHHRPQRPALVCRNVLVVAAWSRLPREDPGRDQAREAFG
jgi:hypothetical protein